MSKNFVYSTLSCDQRYTIYEKGGADLPRIAKQVFIKGGSNVMATKGLLTPQGVVTQVTDEELEALRASRHFADHVRLGFVKVENRKVDPEVAVADGMEIKDKSAQLTPNDFEEGKAPKTAASEEKESTGKFANGGKAHKK